MSEFDTVMLYFAVSVVLCGFLAAFGYVMRLKGKGGFTDVGACETNVEWGPPDRDERMKCCNRIFEDCIVEPLGFGEWQYANVHNPGEKVTFTDPADAFEYVIAAIKDKESQIERIENSLWIGPQQEWWYIDVHMDREYWLDQLKEFREDD